ncbi:ParB N-terminal domain-containing protein [Pararhodobacter sp. SW119]|uniref:ParB/RepB/Spo0J family partition protein n=1 Tax=Pararhodobacter sp. SW119 TaxID=2780075 RepID=UPI001ADFA679|nr:ParB N-terminal domain-containing protein [Pararhodobacter sp. SW119]
MTDHPTPPETAQTPATPADTTAAPQVHLIAPADILAEALPRDRTALDPAALAELEMSVLLDGLRQPIEVWAIRNPAEGGPRYGLISGMRRLTVFQRLHQHKPDARIPAFIREPHDLPDAMARMIAENEIRAEISPWEKGRIVVESVHEGLFDTLDAAVATLYKPLNKQRRNRIRAIAEVVSEIGDRLLSHPETLSQTQLTRIAAAIRQDRGPLIEHALLHSADRSPDGQWKILLPILEEVEGETRAPQYDYRPGRPRRIVHPRVGLHIRREKSVEGWNLRFTGPDATGPLMEDIMDYVEQQFGR